MFLRDRSSSNARVWLTGSAIAWAAVLFGYDSSYIGTTITLPAFKRDYGLNSLSSTQLAVSLDSPPARAS